MAISVKLKEKLTNAKNEEEVANILKEEDLSEEELEEIAGGGFIRVDRVSDTEKRLNPKINSKTPMF
ncbi:MAG: hypothetical protein K6B75_09260 [Lachnospiraceae bacterium]|nr:hypothetical protein [Lachnospiraceae bacterium]